MSKKSNQCRVNQVSTPSKGGRLHKQKVGMSQGVGPRAKSTKND